jgi:hypothetical protein
MTQARGWRRVGTATVRWPGAILVCAIAVSLEKTTVDVGELRDHMADFDDFLRPLRNMRCGLPSFTKAIR